MENESPEIAGTLMTLQKHFWAWDEWVKIQKESGVEKISFGNEFTFENIIKGFTEWTWHSSNSFGFIYDQNKKLEEKNAELEKSNQEYKEKIQQLEVKQEELEIRVEELEERVEIEVEMNLKALDKSKEWHDRRVFVENMKRDCIMIEQRIENDQLKKKLDAYEKKDKIKQIKRLTKKVKTKASERIQKLKEKVNLIKEDVKQKLDTYILQSN